LTLHLDYWGYGRFINSVGRTFDPDNTWLRREADLPHRRSMKQHAKSHFTQLRWIGCTLAGLLIGTMFISATRPGGRYSPPAAAASDQSNGDGSIYNYYVSPEGKDSNDGSSGRPAATIQHAAKMVQPGSTVHVAPGNYDEAIKTDISGTHLARIRFVSDTRWGAKIRSKGVNSTWYNNGNYVDIMGFDVSGDGAEGITNNASFVRIIGNHVHDIPAVGCTSQGGAGINNENFSAHDNDVINNFVHDIGPNLGTCWRVHGIYHANLRGHILNNISFRNASEGISTWHAATQVVIANNTVFANGGSGILVGAGDAPGGVTNDSTVVVNNICVNNRGYGVQEEGKTGTHNVYLANLVHGNARGGFQHQNGTCDLGTVTADPQFVRYTGDGSGDYHLRASSPAINAGTSEDAPATDFDGGTRPIGARLTIGAYAWGNTPAIWPFGDDPRSYRWSSRP